MKVGVPKEIVPGERRVALVPDALGRLRKAGHEVLVESGAGLRSWHLDAAYEQAGAVIVTTDELYAQADMILKVTAPTTPEIDRLRPGQVLVGLLQPQLDPNLVTSLADRGVVAVSLDEIPRTLSRAQSMDVLSSQSNIAGYRAVILAAEAFGRYFPLLTTAAGTARPATCLVLGIGVAGLQAIGTARRLGAVVKAYDVRPETREQAQSLGAEFVRLRTSIDATGSGGYARELTPEERTAQQAELNEVIATMDVVITTAQVPGRRPPVLVTAAAVEAMRPGSVVVDMAASALGGNCELSRAGETVVTENGVTILAPENLAASLPISASQFYARNMAELVLHLTRDGALHLDMDDEITAAVVITRDGSVIQPATAALLPAIAGPGPGGPPASVPSPGVAAPASRGTRSRRASGSRRDEGTGA